VPGSGSACAACTAGPVEAGPEPDSGRAISWQSQCRSAGVCSPIALFDVTHHHTVVNVTLHSSHFSLKILATPQVLEATTLVEHACGIGRPACGFDLPVVFSCLWFCLACGFVLPVVLTCVCKPTNPQTSLSIPQPFAPKVAVHGRRRCQYFDRNSGNHAVLASIILSEPACGIGRLACVFDFRVAVVVLPVVLFCLWF
jgi:hypothetical protein